MINRWNDKAASAFNDDPMKLRIYSSQLLGMENSLVLHGGGNTSVKIDTENFFGEKENVLYVKGSGWDLKTIEAKGFAPVRMNVLLKLAEFETLSDANMVKELKAAMTDPTAPGPSVEAILHAVIPFKFVDHTHADSVVTLTNNENGVKRMKEIYGERVLLVPYVMPGFLLARKIYELTRDIDWSKYDAMILLNHGVFTFGDTAKTAYDKMISTVTLAEEYINKNAKKKTEKESQTTAKPVELATIRKEVGKMLKAPVVLNWNQSSEAVSFSNLQNAEDLATRGTVTPDHVIHIKPFPLMLKSNIQTEIESYKNKYEAYFKRNNTGNLTMLDTAPRWIVWANNGTIAVGSTKKASDVITDITNQTMNCIRTGEALGKWEPLDEKNLFEVEYWELEQAKIKKAGAKPTLQGKIAVVTGAASGIGKASVQSLLSNGACVVGLDIDPSIEKLFNQKEFLGIKTDVTSTNAIKEAIEKTVKTFGGIDILVSNAGSFPPGQKIENLDANIWQKTIEINLNSHFYVLKECISYLKLGFDPAVVIIASKNVAAPGPGASAYSVSKAGLTQLARVAALELAESGVRVNVLHPDAVFDTGVWTKEVLENRAKHYGLTVDQYKTKNLLRTEILSQNVADLITATAGPTFAKTTGAQISIDGGNDRVI